MNSSSNINIFSNFSSCKSFSRLLGQLFLTLGLKQFLKQILSVILEFRPFSEGKENGYDT